MPNLCRCIRVRLWLLALLPALAAPAVVAGLGPPERQPKRPTTAPASAKDRVRARLKDRDEERPVSPPASAPSATQPTTTSAAAEKAPQPQVEVFIPSAAALRDAARRSNTAEIYQALSGMAPSRADETDESLDVAATLKLVDQIAAWPDTSIVVAVYAQDREGRPRWAVRVDWPLRQLRDRIQEALDSEAARKILKDVKLVEGGEGTFRLELPEYVLAVLSPSGEGSSIASSLEVKPPPTVFGQEGAEKPPAASDVGERKSKKRMLAYSRLNLEAGEEESGSSFAMLSGVRDLRYGLQLDDDGQWNEKLIVQWNPLIGAAMKMAFRKTDKPFDCPRAAYAMAVFNFSTANALADALSGLPPGTIGERASRAAAFAAAPGNGFFPFPDVYFQFHVSKKDKIIDSVRDAIKKDTDKRKEDEKPPAWHEDKVDDHVVFWCDTTADYAVGLMPATYRTVLFFDEAAGAEEDGRTNLIIAYRTTSPLDTVKQWRELTKGKKSRIALPDSPKASWQARINWRSVYALAQPYLGLLSAVSEDTTMPPTAEELGDVLADSVINLRIEYSGLEVRHVGPIPFGAVYVPGIVVEALSSSSRGWTEAAREQVACRHLRVLYHHAKFFKKDYGRWPGTVAELDGYVDFASHPDLLSLWKQDRSFAERLASSLAASKGETSARDEDDIDDSLYQIEWTPDSWKLKFREGEFKEYATIYIDAEGEIHRVAKPAATQPAETAPAGSEARGE